jgi:HK97 family phage prohead protease
MKRQQFNSRQTFITENPRLKIQRRTFSDASGKEQTVTTLSGYAILWNQNSTDRGGYVVRLAPNSAIFTKPVLALYHHDFKDVLATTANNTLRVGEADATGVPVEMDLDMNDTMAANVAARVASGRVSGMSFSMANGFEEYTEAKENGQDVITCTKFTADEVTVTPIPAFKATTIGVVDDAEDIQDGGADEDKEDHAAAPVKRIAAARKLRRSSIDMLDL